MGVIVPLKQMKYAVYGDLIRIYPKPYSIYLRGTIGFEGLGSTRPAAKGPRI